MASDEQSDAASIPWSIQALSALTAFFMLAILVVMVVDVFGRYVLDESLYGGFEVIEYLLGLLIFSGFPIVTIRQEHISVSLLETVFTGTFNRIRKIIVLIASAIAVAFIAYRVWGVAVILDRDDQVGQVLDIQIAPYVYGMSVLAGVTALLLITIIWEYFKAWPDEPPRPNAVHSDVSL